MEGYNLAVREGLRNFRRARTLSLAMAGCVAVAVFAMGAFGFLVLNVNSLLKRWESRVELVAFLSRGPEAESPQKVLDSVRSIKEVGEARLVSGQQSWEELFSEAGNSLDLGEVPLDEVLPPSIVIRLVQGNRDLSVIRRVASRVASIEGVDEVRFEETLLERYLQFRREMAGFAAGTSVFWILAFGIITVNIARLASTARKSEIRTLRMLGASTKFIRRVFAVEGIAQGVLRRGCAGPPSASARWQRRPRCFQPGWAIPFGSPWGWLGRPLPSARLWRLWQAGFRFETCSL
jgi:cell division transport system permease protein